MKTQTSPITVNFEDLRLSDERFEVDKMDSCEWVFVVSQSDEQPVKHFLRQLTKKGQVNSEDAADQGKVRGINLIIVREIRGPWN